MRYSSSSNSNRNSQFVRLSDLVEVNPTVDVSKLSNEDQVSFIPMADVSDHGQWEGCQKRSLADVSTGYTTFQENDVLFAKITPCTENGKGCHATGLVNGVGFGSTEFHVLRANNGVHPRLVYHLSVSADVRANATSLMGGSAGQQRVPSDFVRAVRVSLKAIEQQETLVPLLDSVDEAIQATRAVIDQTRRLKTALLQDLLTNGLPGRHTKFIRVYRIGKVPKAWSETRIEQAAEVTQGIALGPSRVARQNPTPYLRVANVHQSVIHLDEIKCIETTSNEQDQYALELDDVLMVEGHANIEELGRAALVPPAAVGMVFQNHLFRVRTDRSKLDPRFLTLWINSHPGRAYFKIFGGTTSGLNTVGSNQIRTLRLPLPPIDEQKEICDLVETMEQRGLHSEKTLEQLQTVKSALSQGLLMGRIPVKGVE